MSVSPSARFPVPEYMRQAPKVGPLPLLSTPQPVRFRLSCGVEVLAIHRDAAPIVAMNLVLRTGANRDPVGRAGLSSLTAEMLDEGAGDRNALEISEATERLGADLWVGAGRDGCQLTLQVPASEFVPGLQIAADILLRPRLLATDWERVQHDRLTGLAQRRDQPEAVADLVAAMTLYGPHHPYGRPVDGFESTVGAMSLDDVKLFHQQYWRPNNAILTVSGAFTPGELEAQLNHVFGKWAPVTLPATPFDVTYPARPRLVVVDRPGASQSVIRIIGPGTHRFAEDRPTLSMLNVILGGSFTSRLNFTLREVKGYTYGASSNFSAYRYPSAFVARSSVFSKVTAPAVTEFLNEIEKVRVEDATEAEVTKAKASLLDRTAEALSTSAGTAATFSELGLYDLPMDEPARFIRAVEATDAQTIRAVANRYLDTSRLTIVIVGDRAAMEPELLALGLPPPVLRGADGEFEPA
jgi:zinc protease